MYSDLKDYQPKEVEFELSDVVKETFPLIAQDGLVGDLRQDSMSLKSATSAKSIAPSRRTRCQSASKNLRKPSKW